MEPKRCAICKPDSHLRFHERDRPIASLARMMVAELDDRSGETWVATQTAEGKLCPDDERAVRLRLRIAPTNGKPKTSANG
jgi:hypothetical protein